MSARTILKHLHQQGRMTDYQFDVINRNLRERPQGEWIFDKDGYFYCSNCKKYPVYQVEYSDYCPNCGAKMTKEVEE